MTTDSHAPHGRVDLSHAYAIRGWATRLGVSKHELLEAVATVGDDVEDIRRYLVQTGACTPPFPVAPPDWANP